MRKREMSLVLATLLFGSVQGYAEELLKNGSFEQFTIKKDHGKWKEVLFDHWEGEGEVWTQKLGRTARDGIYKAELDAGRRTVDTLSQTIVTEAGRHYLISLDAYARKKDSSDFEILVDGEVLASVTPQKRWAKYGVEFTGTGGEQTISIREKASQNNGRGAVIDNVSVRPDTTLDALKAEERAKYEIIEPAGIDQILDILEYDRNIQAKNPAEEIDKAVEAARGMNDLIKKAIHDLGLANDGVLSIADARQINLYLTRNHADRWRKLREDYELVNRMKGRAETRAMGRNAVRDLWGSIYNLGFELERNRTTDLNGKRRRSIRKVGYFLNTVMKNDLPALENPDFEEVRGTTNTHMDRIVDVILTDRGLLRNVPTEDLRVGAEMADKMNHLILEAIEAKGIANDRKITPADVRSLNTYLVERYESEWAELHGDDEEGEETGYHRVQSDGATTRMFGRNVMNTIADGIYHLGYPTPYKNRLVNEDGNKNQTFEDVAWWLDTALKKDMEAGKLDNPEVKEVKGETGTSFDKIVDYIYRDEGLQNHVSLDDIREGARCANEMNKLIVEAIRETGVASDHYISVDEVKRLNTYLVDRYAAEWAELHGDDEEGEETGFHRIQNDGAVDTLEGRNMINNLVDGIYHLGYATPYKDRLVNEDGNKNVSFRNVSYWLNKYLKEDFDQGLFD
ncbi:hypothetical protein [Hydrogenimonas sp.]